MPPQRYLEDYLELVAAVEDTAASLGVRILIEGYTPPHDPRFNTIRGDARSGRDRSEYASGGVLGRTGEEHVRALRRGAPDAVSATEKFMLDGRHTGTGGGNHIVVGGPKQSDSPLLRNPGLLRSLIGYWHNHPSLSYLFSGLICGAPDEPGAARVDEARNDQVYELEIAFRQIPEGRDCPPWLVDRIFRNLLTDATGNAHRAEFCIDKLYTPEAAAGRLGLLEMRAFEMPPHSRTCRPDAASALLAIADLALLEAAVSAKPGALAHGTARSLHVAPFCAAGYRRCAGRVEGIRISAPHRVVRAALRIPVSVLRENRDTAGLSWSWRQAIRAVERAR